MLKWLFGPSARLVKLNQTVSASAQDMQDCANQMLGNLTTIESGYQAIADEVEKMPEGPVKESARASLRQAFDATHRNREQLERQISSASSLKRTADKYLGRA